MTGLAVDRLIKRFDQFTAVDRVSFRVDAGEFVSLLGPSGCGKTTTLRCIAGFERPDGGRIVMNGEVLNDPDAGIFVPPHKRRFGMVFQSYAVWPHMTVMQNVGYPLKVQGKSSQREITARVMEQLAIVGLAGLEGRYPSQLSGGQQQRVALARALVMEPRLLLFDEPLSNLDAKLRERMRFELTEIQSRLGVPAVYVTHDQAEAMVMSRRIVVMSHGRISQEGPPAEIYMAPRSRYVAEFIGLSNFMRAEVRGPGGSGRWAVHSPLGEHECVSLAEHRPGEDVLLAVRPERVELATTMSTGAFAADIRSHYFTGPYSEYVIGVDGLELRVQSHAMLDLRVGDRAFAKVAPEHVRIVAEDPAEMERAA